MMDPKELERLRIAANEALFALHDYMRKEDPMNDYAWRVVYRARCEINSLCGKVA